MLPYGYKKSGCVSEAESGGTSCLEDVLTKKIDSATDSHDPPMEHKILLKIESLRERLSAWARNMDELVYFVSALGPNQSIHFSISPEVMF